MEAQHSIQILAEKSQYHRFALYYDYTPDRVMFCRALRDSVGWKNFSYDSSGEKKRWVFSDANILGAILFEYPRAYVDEDVKRAIMDEAAWIMKKKKVEDDVEQVKQKSDTDFNVKGLKRELYPYQRVGVEFFIKSNGRSILADEMGTGKTAQTIAYVKHMQFKRTLVVVPAVLKFVWANEIAKWTNLSSYIIGSKTDLSDIPHDVNFWIINYDILKKFTPELLKIKFDCIVGDEAHYVKSISAQRTKSFRFIARDVPHVIMLTGTPLLSRPVELFSLLNIIDPKEWPNYFDYTRKYCDAKQTRFGYDVSGSSNEKDLSDRIRPYFLRRKKSDVLSQLPPKNYIEVPVELDATTLRQYSNAEADLANYLRVYSGKQPKEIAKTLQAEKLAKLNILRMINTRGKMPIAKELINSIIDAGEKVVVFSSFIEPLHEIHEELGKSAVIITGKVNDEDRKTAVERFQSDKNVSVFLGGIKSAGVGLTLTAAANVIFLDYSWNPADHTQAQDRVHRPGTTASSINIYYLTSIDTIDTHLLNILKKKQQIFDVVIEGIPQVSESDTVSSTLEMIMKKHI